MLTVIQKLQTLLESSSIYLLLIATGPRDLIISINCYINRGVSFATSLLIKKQNKTPTKINRNE